MYIITMSPHFITMRHQSHNVSRHTKPARTDIVLLYKTLTDIFMAFPAIRNKRNAQPIKAIARRWTFQMGTNKLNNSVIFFQFSVTANSFPRHPCQFCYLFLQQILLLLCLALNVAVNTHIELAIQFDIINATPMWRHTHVKM